VLYQYIILNFRTVSKPTCHLQRLIVSLRTMNPKPIQYCHKMKQKQGGPSVFSFLIERAYSVLIISALICTLFVKLYHALRYNLVGEYKGWILSDISFLLVIELILALLCYRWPRKWIIRTAVIIAALICTWSVMNAGWLIRTGTQILPRVLLPLFRAPLNTLCIIGVNLAKMPRAAVMLLGPSAIALAFFFYVLAKPKYPNYNRRRFIIRAITCAVVILTVVTIRFSLVRRRSPQAASVDLRYNAQLKAVTSLVIRDYIPVPNPERKIPLRDQLKIETTCTQINHNIVIVVLEGVQYQYTSLADDPEDLTPCLKGLADQGVEFTNTRSLLTHTTKALFTLLTGSFPSASQDIAEAVPIDKHYASLATILSDKMGYKTAFFQSAKGDFECRPGLVYNLGFQKFWSRDDLNDPNCFVGYLGSDEFSMLKPISEWIKSDGRPFFITILCSVTHDPYEVPEWFGTPAKEKIDCYRQAISYTDTFLAALDVELTNLNLSDKTIFCVIGDHGEAFGEHGQLGHERIAFDEVLRVPFCLRAPFLLEPASTVTGPVSSVDLTPTLLAMMGFNVEKVGFDGIDALKPISEDRRVYFSGWMQEGPAGYIQDNRKYIYDPMHKTTFVYNLDIDKREQIRLEVSELQAQKVAEDITTWRKNTIFQLNQERNGKKKVFDNWLCRWTHRVSSAKYEEEAN